MSISHKVLYFHHKQVLTNMHRILLPIFALCCLGLSNTRAQTPYVTLLTGHQEVPSTTTLAEGFVQMTLTGDSLEVTGGNILSLSSPIDTDLAGGAHIHTGFTGQNGPVILPIGIIQNAVLNATFIDSTYFVGDIPGFADLLASGQAYVNVHTLDWPGGEVRGQIFSGDQTSLVNVFDATLYGDQQNSPVVSDGIGGIVIAQTPTELIVTGSFELDSPLTPAGGTGTHLHIGYHGQNGPIALTLTPTMGATDREGTFEASNNTFSLANGLDTLIQAIGERRVYVNIHSEAHPSGEIRGQVVQFNNNVYYSYVSYSDPTPFPIAESVMRLMAEKPVLQDFIQVSGSYSGWNANLLAIPLEPFVQFTDPRTGQGLTVFLSSNEVRDPSGTSGVVTLSTQNASLDALFGLQDRLFARSGWVTNTGARVIAFDSPYYHECKRAFHSAITGSQAVPSSNSGSFGEIVTEYYTDRIEASGIVQGLSGPLDVNAAGGMHIHSGFAGQAGPIEESITFTQFSPTAIVVQARDNLSFIDTPLASAMRSGGLYYNLHTTAFPSGEARGQVLPRSNTTLHGIMSAGQTVPASGLSLANGAMMGELYADKVVFSGSFNDLDGGFDPNVGGGSHLHGNIPGRAGDILETLLSGATVGATNGVFFRENNTFDVSSNLIDSFVLRGVYTNIHSLTNPSGELRGQIGPLADNVTHGVLSPDVTIPYTGMQGLSLGTGHLHAEVYDTTVVVSGSFTDLSAAVDTSIAGGAHLHAATVGVTGDIIFPLNILLDSAQTTAILNPVVNTFNFSTGNVSDLLDGNVYANIHTLDAPSGAIRGQMLLSENQFPEPSPLFLFPSDGALVDLGSDAPTTVATIDWVDGEEFDAEQDFGSFWQLFADTTMSPVFQSQVTDSSGISFTFAALDALLMDLGVAQGEMATVFHRSATTDGSLIAFSDLSEVTFTRRFVSSVNELPEGSARLVNTLNIAGGELILDIDGLEAGELTYQISGMNGNVISEQQLQHAGAFQRYVFQSNLTQSGMYALTLRDEQGRSSSWMFVVK